MIAAEPISPTEQNNFSEFNPNPTDTDLFGSCTLHHAVAYDNPDIKHMKILLEKDPNCASLKNQFGRIPLHYVVDRCHASFTAVCLLVEAYPEGSSVLDGDGLNPCKCQKFIYFLL
jgi:hypothetical protein